MRIRRTNYVLVILSAAKNLELSFYPKCEILRCAQNDKFNGLLGMKS